MKKLKKTILHIGSEKTGTTTIQKFMASNREFLMDRKILYPVTPGKENHKKLAIYAADINKNLARFEKIYDNDKLNYFRSCFEYDLTKEILTSDAEVLCLSAEWLHPRVFYDHELERLVDLLYRFTDDVRILIYVRRQDELLVSLYSTALHAGDTKEFAFPRVNASDIPYYLNYSEIASKWSKFFGADTIMVRIFEKKCFFDGDLIRDFIQALGIQPNNAYIMPKIYNNQAINVEGQEIIRSLNDLGRKNNEITVNLIRRAVNRIEVEYAGWGILASRESAFFFASAFAKSNEELRARYFQNSKELFSSDFSSYPVIPESIDKYHVKSKLTEILMDLGMRDSQLANMFN
jgi:hypothetical protein